MTISSETSKVILSGNSSTTVFSFSPIVIQEPAGSDPNDLNVTKTSTTGVETTLIEGTGSTNYSVTVASYPGTGSITYPATGATRLETGENLTIKRSVALLQNTNLENQGGYFPDVQEDTFDYGRMVDIQQQDESDRSLKSPVSDSALDMTIPNVADRASKYLGFTSLGVPTALAASGTVTTDVSDRLVLASGATASRTLANHLGDYISVKDFGAVGDGSTDDVAAFNAALATGKTVYVPRSTNTYKITTTLSFANDGQFMFGDGKFGQSRIENSANSNPLFTFSTGTGAVFRRRCGLRDLEFIGNSNTTAGIAIRGIVDDSLTSDADKGGWLENVRIVDVGAGSGLRVAAWAGTYIGVEIWDGFVGLEIGSECNGVSFYGLYINNCTEEAILFNASQQPSNINFFDTTAQFSGDNVVNMINIKDGYGVNFDGLYLENGLQSGAIVHVNADAKGVMLRNVTHTLNSGTSAIPIIETSVKGVTIDGVFHTSGATMTAFVKITGTLPFTYISGLEVIAGTVTVDVDDSSTRKATFWADALTAALPPLTLKALTSENILELVNSATNAIQAFWLNAILYFGATTSALNIRAAGTALEVHDGTNGSGSGNIRVNSVIISSGDIKIISGSSTPESAVTAGIGSLFLQSDGGAGTSLWVKESGTGNTGWIAMATDTQP